MGAYKYKYSGRVVRMVVDVYHTVLTLTHYSFSSSPMMIFTHNPFAIFLVVGAWPIIMVMDYGSFWIPKQLPRRLWPSSSDKKRSKRGT